MTKKLTLIRHAKSAWDNTSLADFERPLNPRGRKAAPIMGRRLAERHYIPEQLISSPARRARKTAYLLAIEMGIPKRNIVYQSEIYGAGKETLLKLVGNLPGSLEHVALIGHNPDISELAQWLCPGSTGWLPTCAALILELEIDNWTEVNRG